LIYISVTVGFDDNEFDVIPLSRLVQLHGAQISV
jgi:hypothetical protein